MSKLIKKLLIIVGILLVFEGVLFADTLEKNVKNNGDADIQKLHNEMILLQERLSEVRRDQLNYSIEKDLLKETYSSNYKTVNIVITLILGIIGVSGALGLKSIISLRKQYAQELQGLNALKTDFERETKEFKELHKQLIKDLETISKINVEQTKELERHKKSIDIIKLREKVSDLVAKKSYKSAIDAANYALKIEPLDEHIIEKKAFSQFRIKQYIDSANTYKELIRHYPYNFLAIGNLIENYIIMGAIADAQELLDSTSKEELAKVSGDGFVKFVEVLMAFAKREYEEMAQLIQNHVAQIKQNKGSISWEYQDVEVYLRENYIDKNVNVLEVKQLMEYFNVLKGKT